MLDGFRLSFSKEEMTYPVGAAQPFVVDRASLFLLSSGRLLA